MRNEKAFRRAKRRMVLRSTVHEYLMMYWNPKNVLSWVYWIWRIVGYPILLRCSVPDISVKGICISDAIVTIISMCIVMLIDYLLERLIIEMDEKWCKERDW